MTRGEQRREAAVRPVREPVPAVRRGVGGGRTTFNNGERAQPGREVEQVPLPTAGRGLGIPVLMPVHAGFSMSFMHHRSILVISTEWDGSIPTGRTGLNRRMSETFESDEATRVSGTHNRALEDQEQGLQRQSNGAS